MEPIFVAAVCNDIVGVKVDFDSSRCFDVDSNAVFSIVVDVVAENPEVQSVVYRVLGKQVKSVSFIVGDVIVVEQNGVQGTVFCSDKVEPIQRVVNKEVLDELEVLNACAFRQSEVHSVTIVALTVYANCVVLHN